MAASGRWATYLALAVVVGAFGARWVLRGAGDRRRIALVGLIGAVVLLPAALVRLGAQVAEMADPSDPTPDWRALLAAVAGHTHWGHIWIAHVALAVLAAAGFALAMRGSFAGWVVAGVAVLGLAMTPALGGHAAEAKQLPLLVVVADVLHVVAGGLWVGTLAVLIALGLTRSETDLETVRAFSPLALGSAAVLALSGVIAAWSHLGMVSALWTTMYGRTLLIKLALVGCVLACGAYNWKRVTPRLAAGDPGGRPAFARAVASELAFGVLVFLATAILVATPLPGME
ncbi:MAG TPA: CopD family protein [Gemmatimonadaceae bacterium]|jgi:putative copper export protein|nr:CopD family protein [Gemmatimonadaceae bacterium]